MCPHLNSVNRGMPASLIQYADSIQASRLKTLLLLQQNLDSKTLLDTQISRYPIANDNLSGQVRFILPELGYNPVICNH